MIELVPYQAIHLFDLMEQGILEGCPRLDTYNAELAVSRENDIGTATAMLDGTVLACAGVKQLWPGVGDMWAVFSPRIDDHKTTMARIAKTVLKNAMTVGQFHRIQCYVIASFTRGLRLAQFLGFKEEGFAKQYTIDRDDCFLFAITR